MDKWPKNIQGWLSRRKKVKYDQFFRFVYDFFFNAGFALRDKMAAVGELEWVSFKPGFLHESYRLVLSATPF